MEDQEIRAVGIMLLLVLVVLMLIMITKFIEYKQSVNLLNVNITKTIDLFVNANEHNLDVTEKNFKAIQDKLIILEGRQIDIKSDIKNLIAFIDSDAKDRIGDAKCTTSILSDTKDILRVVAKNLSVISDYTIGINNKVDNVMVKEGIVQPDLYQALLKQQYEAIQENKGDSEQSISKQKDNG